MANSSKTFCKLTIPLLVLLTISFSAIPAQAKYGGGTGEPNDPYLIYDANQMNAIGADSNDWDKHFILMADINLSGFTGTEFNIVGRWIDLTHPDNRPFSGVFDGNDHTISNFTYTSTDRNGIGLFGYIGGLIRDLGLIDPNVDAGTGRYVGSLGGCLSNGTISNCYVQGASVKGDSSVGGLVGLNYYGTISNCYSESDVSGMTYHIGGLVGWNIGTISNCYSTGDVSGDFYAGGLVGYNSGTITKCYAMGSVSATYTYVGGLVGFNVSRSTIINSYSTASVTGYRVVGGLVGENWYGTITNCYSTGSVVGDGGGGLVGYNNVAVSVVASFWDIETSGPDNGVGTPLPTEQMQTASTFTDAGWDFESVWWILEGAGYPRLCWEEKYGGGAGEPNDPYLIFDANQMNAIGADSNDWDKHFRLMADIDLSGFTGTSFNIIGYFVDWDDNKPFTGVFDGSGHTISNFTYTSTGINCIGLFGYVDDANAVIKDLGLIDPNVDAGTETYVGSLVGQLYDGTITNCFVEGGSVWGRRYVGGLAGYNGYGKISNCYSANNVTGEDGVGGLAGGNYYGTITNCYSTGSVTGDDHRVGGLVGENEDGSITDCFSTGSVSGDNRIGGLVGKNEDGSITDCFSMGSVIGRNEVGGLVGHNYRGTITNSYANASVSGNERVGGLVGYEYSGVYTSSFWDNTVNPLLTGIGNATDPNVIGESTTNMQTMSTFTDAGWDFNTPVWTIDEGVDYPRLWWEMVPVLHAEPEVTLGTTNTISWDPVPGANDYYAECAEDANFTSILYSTGWITETSCEFTGLELGQRYWYSVKARNITGIETGWSNVESSLQVTLADAVAVMLDPDTLKNKNLKNALLNKINAVQQMLDAGRYEEALNKLQNDILQKTDGCAETGEPDKNDWIITCEEQGELYPLVIETIENVKGLMNQ